MTVIKMNFDGNHKYQGFQLEIETDGEKPINEIIDTYISLIEDTSKQRSMNPKCPVCLSDMKLSKSGQTWQCVNAKWKKENDVFVNNGCSGSLKV